MPDMPTPTEQLRVAAQARVSITTARRAYAGGRVLITTWERLCDAARVIGCAAPPRPNTTVGTRRRGRRVGSEDDR